MSGHKVWDLPRLAHGVYGVQSVSAWSCLWSRCRAVVGDWRDIQRLLFLHHWFLQSLSSNSERSNGYGIAITSEHFDWWMMPSVTFRRLLYHRPHLNTEWLTTFAGCSAGYAVPAWAFQPLRVLNALSIPTHHRVVAPLSVYQQSTGRDSDNLPSFLVGLLQTRLSGTERYHFLGNPVIHWFLSVVSNPFIKFYHIWYSISNHCLIIFYAMIVFVRRGLKF